MVELQAHSPLGASGAGRWLVCPGSVGLSYGVDDEEDDTFSTPGKAAHAVAAHCLTENMDAWECIGALIVDGEIEGAVSDYDLLREQDKAGLLVAVDVDKDMADAVQVYLDAVRHTHPDRNQGNTWIERRFHCPDIHEHFYGTSDFTYHDAKNRKLHVWDYKHGAGIVVEVKENPQLMYYGCGMLEELSLWDEVDRVILHIAQPRGFHFDGPLRHWAVSTDDLILWLEDTLVPAMDNALVSRDTKSGEHCRFCPARGRACPQIMQDMDELEAIMQTLTEKDSAKKLTAKQTGRFLDLLVVAKITGKQALKNATGMLNAGHKVPGWKLAKAKSNREFKEGADAAAKKKFGKGAYTVPELKSPAKIDVLPEGEAFTTRWAFKPDAGNTVVPKGDSRMTVSKDTKSLFKPAKKRRKK